MAWNALKYIGSTIWSALSNLPGLLYNAGYNAVIGLWNGITGLAGWLWSKVQNLGVSMWNAFMKGIGAASPSKKFAEAGKWAMLGAAMGLDDHSGTLMDTAHGIASDLANIPLGLNADALNGQLTAATNSVVQVKANRKQQEVKVTLDVSGTDSEMKKMIQKMARTSNLLQTA
jgi:phage-related protein